MPGALAGSVPMIGGGKGPGGVMRVSAITKPSLDRTNLAGASPEWDGSAGLCGRSGVATPAKLQDIGRASASGSALASLVKQPPVRRCEAPRQENGFATA
jgi:hypothetical protein